ncbi:MAG: hypothetical protein WC178_02180 [Candidatus Paceibacterota bacterium]
MDDKKKILIVSGLLIFLFLSNLASNFFNEVRIPELDPNLISVSKKMSFGVTINSASAVFGDGKTSSVDFNSAKKDIEAASTLGSDLVRINLEGEMLEKAEDVNELKEVIVFARAEHMKIFLAFWGRESRLGSFNAAGKSTFDDFRKSYIEDTNFLMDQFAPEYMLILPECPYWAEKQVSSEVSPDEWFDFAKDVALSVKKKSFETKVVVEGDFYSAVDEGEKELEFVKQVMEDNGPTFDVVSLNIKNAQELEDSTDKLLQMGDKYHWHGELWMGDVEFSKQNDEKLKNFIIYAMYLADSNDFGGFVISQFRDSSISSDGILSEDFSQKSSYGAIKNVIDNRR